MRNIDYFRTLPPEDFAPYLVRSEIDPHDDVEYWVCPDNTEWSYDDAVKHTGEWLKESISDELLERDIE